MPARTRQSLPPIMGETIRRIAIARHGRAHGALAALARDMGVTTETIQQWTKDRNHPSGPADRLLRLYAAGVAITLEE